MKLKSLAMLLVLACSPATAQYKYRYTGTALRSARRVFPNIIKFKYKRTEELFNKYVDKKVKFTKLFKNMEIEWKTQYRDTTTSWDITNNVITIYVPLRSSPCEIPLEQALMEYALVSPHKYVPWSKYRKLRKAVNEIKKECVQ